MIAAKKWEIRAVVSLHWMSHKDPRDIRSLLCDSNAGNVSSSTFIVDTNKRG